MKRSHIALFAGLAALGLVGVGSAAFIFGSTIDLDHGLKVSFDSQGSTSEHVLSLGLPTSMKVQDRLASPYAENSGFMPLVNLGYGNEVIPSTLGDSFFVRVRFSFDRVSSQDWLLALQKEYADNLYIFSSLVSSDPAAFETCFASDSVHSFLVFSGSDTEAEVGMGFEIAGLGTITDGERTGQAFRSQDLAALQRTLGYGTADAQTVDLVFALPMKEEAKPETINSLSFNVGFNLRGIKTK